VEIRSLVVRLESMHALCQLFDSHNTETALFVNASNAFNSLNRKVLLHKSYFS